MSGHDDFDFEPTPGIPARLPEGERILWQGSPDWRALARSAFHIRKVAIYFGLLLLWRLADAAAGGASTAALTGAATWVLVMATGSIGLLTLLAWLNARCTIYTITTRRILLRFGVALPMTVNVPFNVVHSAAMKKNWDGTGDLPLQLHGGDRVAYAALWPHVRPWQFRCPQPMFRGIPEVEEAARMLAEALVDFDGQRKAAGVTTVERVDPRTTVIDPVAVPAE